jgi:hypothetical protein
VVEVHVRMRRVYELRREVADVPRRRGLTSTWEGVEAHIWKGEVHAVHDAELPRAARSFLLLSQPRSESPGYRVDEPSVTTTT